MVAIFVYAIETVEGGNTLMDGQLWGLNLTRRFAPGHLKKWSFFRIL